MQENIDFNFLIVGRSGSGKSATSKLLTGDPSITVANSINQVTKQVSFYQGIIHTVGDEQVRFGILDIPGLDKIENRLKIRQQILDQLQKFKIKLHGIIYVASLTERDTIQQNKLFQFIDQLPWETSVINQALFPVFTKYDNFIMDLPDEDIGRTKSEFCHMFKKIGYEAAWSKRVYWVNYTKSLDYKMKVCHDVQNKYENQIERLVSMIKKNKKPLLTIQGIRNYMIKQQNYVLTNFLTLVKEEKIPYALVEKTHQIPLHLKIQPHSNFVSCLTTISVSSISIAISKGIKKDIPAPFYALMMAVPFTLSLINLVKSKSEQLNVHCPEETSHQILSNLKKGIFKQINFLIEQQCKKLNHSIQFFLKNGKLECIIDNSFVYNFFCLDNCQIKNIAIENVQYFQKNKIQNSNNIQCFQIKLPELEEGQNFWDPIIQISYHIKAFDESSVMKTIQKLQQQFTIDQ